MQPNSSCYSPPLHRGRRGEDVYTTVDSSAGPLGMLYEKFSFSPRHVTAIMGRVVPDGGPGGWNLARALGDPGG